MVQRFAAGVIGEIGLRVKCGAAFQDQAEIVHGFAAVGHGPQVALGDDAVHVVFRLGLEPDCVAMGEEEVEAGGVRHQAAGGGDDAGGIGVQGFFQGLTLVPAVGVGAVEGLDFGWAAAGEAGDFGAEFDEGTVQGGGGHFAEGGFAGAAQADEGDAVGALFHGVAEEIGECPLGLFQLLLVTAGQDLPDHQPFGGVGGFIAQEFGERTVQRLGDLLQDQDGDVADAGFEVGEVAFGDLRRFGEHAAGHAAAGAEQFDALAEGGEEGVFVWKR